MKELTPDTIAGLKAAHGDRLTLVEVEDSGLVVKPPTRPQFDAYVNAAGQPKTRADGEANLAIACAVWPTPSEVSAMFDRLPAMPALVANEIAEIATGKQLADLAIDGPEVAATGVDVAKLRAQYPHKGQLAAYDSAIGVILVHRPSRSTYNDSQRKLREKAELAVTFSHLVIDCVIHPANEAARAEFDRFPGIVSLLWEKLRAMAGADAEARAKKI